MGYEFNGFFAAANEAVLEAALEHWPYCRGRMIGAPFVGIGVATPPWPELPTVEEEEIHFQRIHDFDDGLMQWTENFEDITFVKIWVSCSGSQGCAYRGYACRNGLALYSDETPTLDKNRAKLRLLRLLSYLGVNQEGHYFLPFERGFFDKGRWG